MNSAHSADVRSVLDIIIQERRELFAAAGRRALKDEAAAELFGPDRSLAELDRLLGQHHVG